MPVDNATAELSFVAVANLHWQSWPSCNALFARDFAGAFLLVALHHLHITNRREATTAMTHAYRMMHAWQMLGVWQESATCLVDIPYEQHAARCF